jgi:hypothetical protein
MGAGIDNPPSRFFASFGNAEHSLLCRAPEATLPIQYSSFRSRPSRRNDKQ